MIVWNTSSSHGAQFYQPDEQAEMLQIWSMKTCYIRQHHPILLALNSLNPQKHNSRWRWWRFWDQYNSIQLL